MSCENVGGSTSKGPETQAKALGASLAGSRNDQEARVLGPEQEKDNMVRGRVSTMQVRPG